MPFLVLQILNNNILTITQCQQESCERAERVEAPIGHVQGSGQGAARQGAADGGREEGAAGAGGPPAEGQNGAGMCGGDKKVFYHMASTESKWLIKLISETYST